MASAVSPAKAAARSVYDFDLELFSKRETDAEDYESLYAWASVGYFYDHIRSKATGQRQSRGSEIDTFSLSCFAEADLGTTLSVSEKCTGNPVLRVVAMVLGRLPISLSYPLNRSRSSAVLVERVHWLENARLVQKFSSWLSVFMLAYM